MHNIVLQNERARHKRTRNLKYDDHLEERRSKKPLLKKAKTSVPKQKEKEVSERLATMDDFVEVNKLPDP